MTFTAVHVIGGAVGIVSGLLALYAAKGRTLHRRSGMVFVWAMLVMSLSGATIALWHAGTAMNVPAGLVTAYLIVTGLNTVRPSSPASRRVDRGAMLAAFALAAAGVVAAVASGVKGNAGFVYPLVMFAGLALSAGEGDRRMIRDGGLRGAARIRRHLWRMCTALFIAAGSFFLGPIRRIPEPLRNPALRLIPFLVLATMAYWLWRYRRRRAASGNVSVSASEAI
jgi:succinate-acetate transporter protein